MATGSALPFVQVPNSPELEDILDLLKKDILIGLNSHHVGTIQAFNASAQTATVTINYPRTFYIQNQETGNYEPTNVNYPIIINAPVICLGGGGGSLTFPIAQGDECLILFNDRSIDNWFAGGSGTAPSSPRLHAFQDAIILVGLRSSGKVLPGYDTTRVVLQNGSTKVTVGPTLIGIKNNTQDLKNLLQNLITQIENLVTATAAITVTGVSSGGATSGVPANAAAITAINTNLSAISTNIAGLLE